MTLCLYVKTYDCLSLRKDTPSLNAITTVGVSRLFLSFYYRHRVSLADLLSFGFITESLSDSARLSEAFCLEEVSGCLSITPPPPRA
jgi:hypothetical protein